MKTIAFAVLILAVMSVSAQTNHSQPLLPQLQKPAEVKSYPGSYGHPDLDGANVHSHVVDKTEVTNSRLVGRRHDLYVGGSWTPSDSLKLMYSGTHGLSYTWGWLYDTSLTTTNNAGVWDTTVMDVQTIDANDQVTQYVDQTYTGGNFENYLRRVHSWDTYVRETQENDYMWNSGTMSWDNDEQFIMTYQGNLYLTLTKINQDWVANQWRNVYYYTYAYNADNTVDNYVRQDWDTVGNAWVNSYKVAYSYDGNGVNTGYLFQDWTAGAWVNDYEEIYTYDANGNVVLRMDSSWNGSGWDPYAQEDVTYNAGGMQLSYTFSLWDGSTFVPDYQNLETYDANNNQLSFIRQLWDTSGIWNNVYKQDRTYNSYNLALTYFYSSWAAGSWLEQQHYYYYYELYEDGTTGISPSLVSSATAYPNPFVNNTMVTFNNQAGDNAELVLSDVTGKIISQQKIGHVEANYQVLLDGKTLGSGIYFYQLQTSTGVCTGKLVKE